MAAPTKLPGSIHLLTGNKSKKSANDIGSEFRPKVEIPRMPRNLGAHAKTCWKEITQTLFKYGLVTAFDAHALEIYCTTYQRWRDAEEALAKGGAESLIALNTAGKPGPSPLYRIAIAEREALNRMAKEFGFTPSARASMRAPSMPAGETGGWDSF